MCTLVFVLLASRIWKAILLEWETGHRERHHFDSLASNFAFGQSFLCHHFSRRHGRFGDQKRLMHAQRELSLGEPFGCNATHGCQ